MLKIIHQLKKQNISMMLSLGILLSVIFCTLNVDVSCFDFYRNDFVDSEASLTAPDGIQEIIYAKLGSISVLKDALSGRSVSGKVFHARNNSAFVVLTVLLMLINAYVFLQSCSYKTILFSHRIIITYIHDLDGMKR